MSVKLRYGTPFLLKIYLAVYMTAICWLLAKVFMADGQALSKISAILQLDNLDFMKIRIVLAATVVLNFLLFLEILQRTKLGWYILITPYIISFIFLTILITKALIAVYQKDVTFLDSINSQKFLVLGAFGGNIFVLTYFFAIKTFFDN